MARISVLPDALASQVAAGEVVERPASVLKELIENSLDAGASHIEVEIRRGGVALLKVSDNGHGMDKENTLLSIERHATSKLDSSKGLASITTHGFRGEALPSIASVARFRMISNNDASTSATEIIVEGGKLFAVNESARAKGTTIEVKDIFFNVPARRKFLKSESTEYAHLEHAIKLSALGNSEVRYTFKNNGRVIWDLKPSQDRRTRIADLSGQAIIKDLKEVAQSVFNEHSIEGYLLPGRLARGSSRSQTVFINGRPVDDPIIKSAIRDGFHGQIQAGQFPVVWLWITMPSELVDVNVHPAKREVRFSRPSEIKHLIIEALGQTLSPKPRSPVAPPKFIQPLPIAKESIEVDTQIEPRPKIDKTPEFKLSKDWSTPDQQDISLSSSAPPVQNSEPHTHETGGNNESPFTYIGTLQKKYWLLEDEQGLVIIDPKAARARITYEQLKRSYSESMLTSQALLVPLLLELDKHDQITLQRHLSTLQELGVEITSLGGDTFQVQSLPTLLDITESGDAENFILGVIDRLENSVTKSPQAKERALELLFTNIAQQFSHTQSSESQFAIPLLDELMRCDLPYCTSEGKPTMSHLSMSELKKKLS